MDVVVDADILSTFTKIDKLPLLSRLFRKSRLLICPCVSRELKRGVALGLLTYSRPPRFSAIGLRKRERALAAEVRGRWNLGMGDAECLAVARIRNCVLLTNDRRVKNIAVSLSVEHLNLPLLLRELWKTRVLPKQRVAELMEEIERKDRVVVKNKLIFK